MSLEYQQFLDEWDKLPEACITSSFPLSLDIELTNRCLMSCEKCPHHGPNRINERIPQDMDFELYKKIIDEGSEKGLRSVKLNYAGEPTLYDRLIDAIIYAKSKGILNVQINTNGMNLTEEYCYQLIGSGIDIIIISDYHSKKQFENVRNLARSRDFFSETPKIRIMIKDKGGGNWGAIADEICFDKYYEYNLEEDFKPSEFKCPQPWQRFLILADGTVCSCSCGIFIMEKILGNAWHFSLEELWNGKQMKFLRYCHENGESHLLRQCRMCPARKEYLKENDDE